MADRREFLALLQGMTRSETVLVRIGLSLLSQIQQDFITKARGGRGRDGIQWQPLAPETIARRRVGPTYLKSQALAQTADKRLYVTGPQNAAWKEIYQQNLARLRLALDDAEAKKLAARVATAAIRRAGGKTKLEALGSRNVEILRDTGELFRSLTPGVQKENTDAPGQVFATDGNTVSVGSSKKPWHHRGVPGRLPSRPLWPLDGNIPSAWWPALIAAARRGVENALRGTP